MKNLAMIALIGLIGLTCVVTTELHAHIWKDGKFAHPGTTDMVDGFGNTLGFVYGRAEVIVSYKFPTITCLHSTYISNHSGGLPDWPNHIHNLRYYFKPKSEVWGPGSYYRVKVGPEYSGFLDSYWANDTQNPGYWWKDYLHHRFPLRGRWAGDYTVDAVVSLTAKYDLDGDGQREVEKWDASVTNEDIEHRKPKQD